MAEWPNLIDNGVYICDVSIACTGDWQIPRKPKRGRMTDENWARKEAEWSRSRSEAYDKWDALQTTRLESMAHIISGHQGEMLQIVHEDTGALLLPDSFTVRLKISGKGLRDFVLNYPYVFEAVEPDDIETPQQVQRNEAAIAARMTFVAPPAEAPAVCVIDSGLQEGHFWLETAIDKPSSKCFLPATSATDVADYVPGGGHGTRVAGAVLYGNSIPKDGTVTFSTWIQNARIVDAAGSLPKEVLPPVVLQDVVRHFHEGARKTRIFNHSINADSPCRVRHMSAWAAEIDQLCNEFDVLIVQSAGNIPLSRPAPKPGIAELISNGSAYPEYFGQAACRIANPAQSFQALTVGSVACGAFESADWRSFAAQVGESSAFSRCGLGLWDSIKPEVVEYGGDCLRNTTVPPVVSTPPSGRECYPELIRSTLTGGPALERDVIGTSFAAPKVAHIAAKLLSVLPTSSCLLYRALIVQSARWPAWAEHLAPAQQTSLLKRIGYGIPDIDRATSNSEHRATFITDADRDIGAGQCHVYQVRIPDALRRPGDEYDIRVEVTLSYVAEPRRTRRTHRGYLSTWLDWVSNRKGEELGTEVAHGRWTRGEH